MRLQRPRVLLAVAASLALVVTACGGDGGGGGEGEPYTFVYPSWMWEEGDVGLWHHDRREEFEEAFDHIEVQTTQIASPDFEQQMLTQISAGQVPDLMPAFTNMLPPLIEEGLLAPLDECLDDSGIEERLLPTASAAQRDGALNRDVTASEIAAASIRFCRPLALGPDLGDERAITHRQLDTYLDGLAANAN
jgi:ABC-type glycerol-3-phosphate transport system substrate-binding protein